MVHCLIRRASLVGMLGLVVAGESVGQGTSACPSRLVDTSGWREVVATIAPFSLRLPADVPEHHYRFQAAFGTTGAAKTAPPRRQFFFSDRDVHGPYFEIAISPRPTPGSRLSVFAADSTLCDDVIDGHSARVLIYRSKPQPNVTYNVLAWVDFTADSVLEFGSSGADQNRQTQALAVLRTLRFRGP